VQEFLTLDIYCSRQYFIKYFYNYGRFTCKTILTAGGVLLLPADFFTRWCWVDVNAKALIDARQIMTQDKALY
jgi:hypothetical protein